MASKLSILHGGSVHHYHELPTELELITLSPERQAVFRYLARIGWDRFPEFVEDILVQKLRDRHSVVKAECQAHHV